MNKCDFSRLNTRTSTISSIQAHVSTYPPMLDLESPGPFIINIDLFLEHRCEVTFPNFSSTLFNGSIMNKGGLTFTDIATGNDIARNDLILCAFDRDGDFKKDNEPKFTTVRPGQKHTMTAQFTRIESIATGSVELPPITAVEEHTTAMKKLPKVWKWRHTRGFDNGKTYRVGIDQDASVKQWLEGSKEELLSNPLAQRSENSMRKKPIKFHVTQAACFAVQRPDMDGSLNWP